MYYGKTQTVNDLEKTAWTAGDRPDPGTLDFLGRMPIPLRRPFKAGLDHVLAKQRSDGRAPLSCHFLIGGEWYASFDRLLAARDIDDLPGMVVSSWGTDVLSARLLRLYGGNGVPPSLLPPPHPAAVAGGLIDPEGVFSVFATIPLVFLIDRARLAGRPAPRRWVDLLDPLYRDDVVFGGWRPNDRVPYQDFNEFLLLCLFEEFGADGIRAFAANVKRLLHNVRTMRNVGTGSDLTGAIAVLPWLQADLCPRRDRTEVIWPEDGALTMPIGVMVKPQCQNRLRPLIDYVGGDDLGAVLAKNRYPPVVAQVANGFPEDARLKWPGWDYVRSHDVGERTKIAARAFFDARRR
jgi:ABC-type Fe3+ transport system substrate-binding protein